MRLWLTTTLVALTLTLTACHRQEEAVGVHRGVYHWKTTYDPTGWEKAWMKEHRVDRLYVKLFDVEPGEQNGHAGWKMVPMATTQFRQKLPADMDVVPVVYITVDAIRALGDSYWDQDDRRFYAQLIVKRIDDMLAEHWVGTLREVQMDCDWTAQTRHAYFMLAEEMKQLLKERGIALSGTLRLHQLRETEWPANLSTGWERLKPRLKGSPLCSEAEDYAARSLVSLGRTDEACRIYARRGDVGSLMQLRQMRLPELLETMLRIAPASPLLPVELQRMLFCLENSPYALQYKTCTEGYLEDTAVLRIARRAALTTLRSRRAMWHYTAACLPGHQRRPDQALRQLEDADSLPCDALLRRSIRVLRFYLRRPDEAPSPLERDDCAEGGATLTRSNKIERPYSTPPTETSPVSTFTETLSPLMPIYDVFKPPIDRSPTNGQEYTKTE